MELNHCRFMEARTPEKNQFLRNGGAIPKGDGSVALGR